MATSGSVSEVKTASGTVEQVLKSVKRHFPNARYGNLNCLSIILNPIVGVDLCLEFTFKDRDCIRKPSIRVTSEKLAESFTVELYKLLLAVVNNLTNWQLLGDEIEQIVKCIEVTRQNKMKKKSKKTSKKSLESSRNEEEDVLYDLSIDMSALKRLDLPSLKKNEEKQPRANYFIAIRIEDKDIIKNLLHVQNELVEKEGLLSKGVIPFESLHLTLCNLGLDTADQLLSTIEILNHLKPKLQQLLPKIPFIVHGASQFYNRAIIAKVKVEDTFHSFRNCLIENLTHAGVEFREDHLIYNPHITLIKVRRPERRAFGTRNIECAWYSKFVESIHGEQLINSLYLCAMGGQKREDGFYVTACELEFERDNVLIQSS